MLDKKLLKPCPFCGGRAKVYAGEDGTAVICVICGAETKRFKDYRKTNLDQMYWSSNKGSAFEKAVYSWNTRETDTDKFVRGLMREETEG